MLKAQIRVFSEASSDPTSHAANLLPGLESNNRDRLGTTDPAEPLKPTPGVT